jgi:ABC-type transport system involved in cytochrome c biogenesis permease subunit
MTENRLKGLPVFLICVFAAWLLAGLRAPRPSSPMDVNGFGCLPTLNGGRIKPLDTVARTSLLLLRGKQTVRRHDRVIDADEWLLDMAYKPEQADAYPVIEIDDPDVLGVMGIEQTANRYYTFTDLRPHLQEIENQARQADEVKPEQRSRYQTAISNLQGRVALYRKLQNTLQIAGHDTLGDAWRASDAAAFKKTLIEYTHWLDTKVPADVAHARREFLFNYYEPFYKSMIVYVVVFLLAFFSLLGWSRTLIRSAFYLLVLAFAVHTIGLVSRMILQGRPPVTNLYSSAIFVGWAAVLLGIVLERLYKNGIGSMVASAIGFVTLILAHHLNTQGDTMEMMRAVLDSNFWLATHVVCITIGYSSTFLSGFLAVLYLVRRVFDKAWNEPTAIDLERMVYGIVCFSAFFSFLGTILGGIWADQSWGRFWGWDPKENGALMIVLWNVFILHARLGGLAKQRTIMIMAVFGNIVTAFSWFGVNMLGIGLHSYGFMEKAFVWLILFAISQLAVMALGFIPDYATRRAGARR